MSRISKTLSAFSQQQHKVLIPYLVAGDPNMPTTLQLMHGLVAAGADVIELGVPFSDPSSDGPVIQKGAERSLAKGTTIKDVIDLVAQFRQTNTTTPVVLMGYLNPIEVMGYQQFADAAATAGIDGLLIVDFPPSEAGEVVELLHKAQIDTIFLVAPTTTPPRAKSIVQYCTGYLYYVSLKGVTGAAITDSASIVENVGALRELTDLPIVIGFGIKDATSAATMAELADGVVIGSALVEKIALLPDKAEQTEADIHATVDVIRHSRMSINNIK
jgi:tryptophan synthase alpha chain